MSSLFYPGSLRVYQSEGEAWGEIAALAVTLDPGLGLGAMKAALRDLRALPALEGCHVLLTDGLTGAIPALIESFGFRCWGSDGYAKALLDEIARAETERLAAEAEAAASACAPAAGGCGSGGCGGGAVSSSGCGSSSRPIGLRTGSVPAPETLGNGCYHLDLAAALASGPGLNSYEVLFPFLRQGGFDRLDLECDHLPRWFGPTLAELGLTATTEAVGAGLKVVVRPRPLERRA